MGAGYARLFIAVISNDDSRRIGAQARGTGRRVSFLGFLIQRELISRDFLRDRRRLIVHDAIGCFGIERALLGSALLSTTAATTTTATTTSSATAAPLA
jgi:hypothetical protein